jgi:hypothetical protein
MGLLKIAKGNRWRIRTAPEPASMRAALAPHHPRHSHSGDPGLDERIRYLIIGHCGSGGGVPSPAPKEI